MKHSNSPACIAVMLITIIAIACKEQPAASTDRQNGYTKELKTRQDSLFEEVMEGHDVGMSKTGQLTGYLKNIRTSIDSVKKQHPVDQQRILVMESILADLNQADFSMNRWMEEFKLDSAENNEPVRIAYLESERDKVTRIKERILNSIKRADSLYGR